MNTILIYSTDANLMYNSYKLIAVCSTKQKAIELLTPHLEKEAIENFKEDGYNNSNRMLSDLIYSLNSINQTQSLEKNFVFETIENNKISF